MRLRGTVFVVLLAGEAAGWARSSAEGFAWRGRVGSSLRVHNLNGPIVVEAAAGAEAEVTATVSYERSSPKDIRFEQRADDRGVTICATWPGQTSCLDGGGGESRGDDLAVEFHVKLPRGAAIHAATVNGGLSIRGVAGETHVHTVNGAIAIEGSTGPIAAETVNGGIQVRLGPNPDADIAAQTVTGTISILGTTTYGHARTTLGKGGRTLSAATVNGSIAIR
jgi:hypothetical protein